MTSPANKTVHMPVLPQQVISHLQVKSGGRYVDGTLGAAGHACKILAQQPTAELLGIDRDPEILAIAATNLAAFRRRTSLHHGDYADMADIAANYGWREVDGILLDLGISSLQIDRPERGFSYRQDGPLDMRMDRRNPITASTILNTSTEGELCRIFRDYGEDPNARRIARAIVRQRAEHPYERTSDLSATIQQNVRRSKRTLPPETLIFQALRIAVNDEMGQLERGLDAAHDLLAPGGRLVVISFHSLEDRIVKRRFNTWANPCICPPGMPACGCGRTSTVHVITRQPITAEKEELEANRRAASAKMRCCEKRQPTNHQAA